MASGYYPAGAEYDPNAPYNEPADPETELEVEVVETMVKVGVICTNDAWYVRDEEGDVSLEASNLDARKDWEDQNLTLEPAIKQACEEITQLRIAAEKRQRELESFYGVRHRTIPPDSEKMRKQLRDIMERIRKLKALEEALTGWEREDIDVTATSR